MHQYIYTNLIIYYFWRWPEVSRNSRWRSSKPEVPIFQLVKELATRFQITIPCFRCRTIQWWHHFQHCHATTVVGIQDGHHNNASSYNSALTQCNEKISVIIGHPFPIKNDSKTNNMKNVMSCLTDYRDLDKIVTVCHSFKPKTKKTIQCSVQSVLYWM